MLRLPRKTPQRHFVLYYLNQPRALGRLLYGSKARRVTKKYNFQKQEADIKFLSCLAAYRLEDYETDEVMKQNFAF
jgi:hypothetical protein